MGDFGQDPFQQQQQQDWPPQGGAAGQWGGGEQDWNQQEAIQPPQADMMQQGSMDVNLNSPVDVGAVQQQHVEAAPPQQDMQPQQQQPHEQVANVGMAAVNNTPPLTAPAPVANIAADSLDLDAVNERLQQRKVILQKHREEFEKQREIARQQKEKIEARRKAAVQ
eukprot:TRINITY_DN10306_c0_g1_i1.p1 TRINITY_DN10306_c0_g1~~TRINITY_DN10306_c0_g1_i1.p1  ORF type:complete len:166 (+),score=68.98 TRINITY_DN10306_c0_g1_i1:45-542(+)